MAQVDFTHPTRELISVANVPTVEDHVPRSLPVTDRVHRRWRRGVESEGKPTEARHIAHDK